MSSFFATTLFASSVAAQLTTSIWLPGAAFADVAFLGSVISQSGDKTVLSLDFAGSSASQNEYYSEVPPTVTIGGATFAAYTATAVDLFGEDDTTVTISLGCERANVRAVPTCTMSTAGFSQIYSQLCAAIPTDAPASSADSDAFCTEYSDATTVETLTLSGDSQYYINNFALTITAGTDKLSAAASATANGASSTASGSTAAGSAASRSAAPASGSTSSSGLPTNTGSASASAASVAPSSLTGAAAPMRTMVPALAGMGAAAAAFFM
ncbi:hypothetical protein NX059_010268 [Plenodomus lindquistii]|nr:hypothetical protein NX059_010268 [Plenodomus lindquistii]